MSIDTLRELAARLAQSASALGALAAALDTRRTLDPTLEAATAELRAVLGIPDAVTDGLEPVVAEMRVHLLQAAALAAGEGAGWRHRDPVLLRAAGEVSAAFPALLQRVAPALDGLATRLAAPDAAFVDVGAGVAAMSIAMARTWPRLRVVALEPWTPSLALAREDVAQAGLAARIELREQAVEDLADREAFDLAWVPSAFIPPRAVELGLPRVRHALRPGGWLLFGLLHPGADPLAAAIARVRTASWNGWFGRPADAERLLVESGFSEVRTLPSPPSAAAVMVVGRKGG